MYNIHLLPATFGDSILIEYGTVADPHYILIDGGPYYVFEDIMKAITGIAPNITELELLVVTHIDIDHIDGMVTLLNQSNPPFHIKDIWFNGYSELEAAAGLDPDVLGAKQGEYLSQLIREKGLPHNVAFDGNPVCITDYESPVEIELEGGMKLELLSPGIAALKALIPVWDKELSKHEEGEALSVHDDERYPDDVLGDQVETWQELTYARDKSEANCSSIAFIATYKNKSCLFAADAPSHILLKAIQPKLDRSGEERLQVDAWKLAHHGSKKSTQDEVMQKIESGNILISSDGKRYKHPDAPVIAKILKHNGPGLQFFFNYRSAFNEIWDNAAWQHKYDYTTVFPEEGQSGISISL